MLTVEQLLESGYKEYVDQIHKFGRSWSKIVRGSDGRKRYYVECHEFDWTRYPAIGHPCDRTFSFSVQFTRNGLIFGTHLSSDDLSQAEEFIETLFVTMGCDDY